MCFSKFIIDDMMKAENDMMKAENDVLRGVVMMHVINLLSPTTKWTGQMLYEYMYRLNADQIQFWPNNLRKYVLWCQSEPETSAG